MVSYIYIFKEWFECILLNKLNNFFFQQSSNDCIHVYIKMNKTDSETFETIPDNTMPIMCWDFFSCIRFCQHVIVYMIFTDPIALAFRKIDGLGKVELMFILLKIANHWSYPMRTVCNECFHVYITQVQKNVELYSYIMKPNCINVSMCIP